MIEHASMYQVLPHFMYFWPLTSVCVRLQEACVVIVFQALTVRIVPTPSAIHAPVDHSKSSWT